MVGAREDGLEHQYDVIIIGTGLIESIVVAALTKVGKNVLHYERNEYYGGEHWPSFNFKDFETWVANHPQYRPDEVRRIHKTVRPVLAPTPQILRMKWPKPRWRATGGGKSTQSTQDIENATTSVVEIDKCRPEQAYQINLTPSDSSTMEVLRFQKHSKLLSSGTPGGVTMVNDNKKQAQDGEDGGGSAAAAPVGWDMKKLKAHSREFSLDLSPTLLMAGGDIIQILLNSGVASYLEFRPLQRLYLASPTDVADSSSSSSISFHKVPCSKGDVFLSKLLPAKEKRQLMKFLQLVADWGFQEESGHAVQDRNEIELGQGRSLHRPQNKTCVEINDSEYLDAPFSDFLTHLKLSPHLCWVVRYALALVSDGEEKDKGTTAREGLMRTFKHLSGLGRYGQTAFLWPLFGSCDIIQAFCRVASVWGATFILREQPKGLVLHPTTGDCLGVLDHNGEALACDFVIMAQSLVPPPWHDDENMMGDRKRRRRYALRRISLLEEPILPADLPDADGQSSGAEDQQSREPCGGVLPPGSLGVSGHGSTIYFFCIDPAARCAPEGLHLLYLFTVIEEEDEVGGNDADADVVGNDRDNILEEAAKALLQQDHQQQQQELWAVTYQEHLPSPPPPSSSAAEGAMPPFPANLLVTHRDDPEFYLQSALDQAKELFHRICPGEDFLPMEVPEGVVRFDLSRQQETVDPDEEILDALLKQTQIIQEMT